MRDSTLVRTVAAMQDLTVQQTAALAAVNDYWERHDKPPSVAAVAIKLGVNRTTAHRLMVQCRDKGYLHGPVTSGQWVLSGEGEDLLRELEPKKKKRRAT